MVSGNDPSGQTQPRVVSPEEIQRQEFGVSRFGGYRMRDVDEFLDHLTASTQALMAENERLRGGSGGPILGTPELEEVNRQADEILRRAREEAARIVADASAAGGSVDMGAGDRAAVDAFLTQERDFLQNLATLVGGHAETVKGMARRARQAAVEGPDPTAGSAEAEAEPSAEAEPEAESDAEADADPDDGDDVVDVTDAPDADATQVSVGATPAPPPAAPDRPEPPARGDQTNERDPSLRALFWGDDG
jgi:DivIVA domain-containing protein